LRRTRVWHVCLRLPLLFLLSALRFHRMPTTALQDCVGTLFARAALHRCTVVFAIQLGNKTRANLGWANRLTFVRIGAIAESFCIHHVDHSQHATLSLWMALW